MSQQWKPPENEANEDDVQMPLGTGESPGIEEFSVPRGPRFNSSTLMLVAAFAVAVGVLYLLGLQNRPRVATANETQHQEEINRRIENMLSNKGAAEKVGDLFKSTGHLVEILTKYFEATNKVVELQGNPFELNNVQVAEPPKSGEPVPQSLLQTTSKGLLDATQVYKGLRLQLVLTGNRPSAMINDAMVTVGVHVEMWEVVGISSEGVQLRFKDVDGKATDVILKQNSVPLSNKH